jgi:hypothetical protein
MKVPIDEAKALCYNQGTFLGATYLFPLYYMTGATFLVLLNYLPCYTGRTYPLNLLLS